MCQSIRFRSFSSSSIVHLPSIPADDKAGLRPPSTGRALSIPIAEVLSMINISELLLWQPSVMWETNERERDTFASSGRRETFNSHEYREMRRSFTYR